MPLTCVAGQTYSMTGLWMHSCPLILCIQVTLRDYLSQPCHKSLENKPDFKLYWGQHSLRLVLRYPMFCFSELAGGARNWISQLMGGRQVFNSQAHLRVGKAGALYEVALSLSGWQWHSLSPDHFPRVCVFIFVISWWSLLHWAIYGACVCSVQAGRKRWFTSFTPASFTPDCLELEFTGIGSKAAPEDLVRNNAVVEILCILIAVKSWDT